MVRVESYDLSTEVYPPVTVRDFLTVRVDEL